VTDQPEPNPLHKWDHEAMRLLVETILGLAAQLTPKGKP
jgi:hypothetical protein